MASIRISQLNTLPSITSDDFFPVVDSGSMTTYHVSMDVINDWMAIYGSASHANIADYTTNALSASYARTSSWSLNTITASYALTASYIDLSTYSVSSASWASSSITASNLQGAGVSYENTLIVSQSIITTSIVLGPDATLRIPRKLSEVPATEDSTKNAIWFNNLYGDPSQFAISDDYVRVYFIEPSADFGKLVFSHGDNVDPLVPFGPNIDWAKANYPGFLWQTEGSNPSFATGSLLFLSTNGRLYARSLEARDYTSSVTDQVGFYGTASYAMTASYLNGGLPAATQMAPVVNGLSVHPLKDAYDGVGAGSQIKFWARDLVVYNASGDGYRLSNVHMTNDYATGQGIGGYVAAWDNEHWYDLYVVYNSTTGNSSSVILSSGATTPNQTSFTDVLISTGYDAGYDYGIKIASVKRFDSMWTEWYEYGAETKWTYRYKANTGIGLTKGFNLTHYLNVPPKSLDVRMKLRDGNSTWNGYGYYTGEEIPVELFISDVDDSEQDIAGFIYKVTSSTFTFWQNSCEYGLYLATSSGGRWLFANNSTNLSLTFDLVIYAST